MVKKFNQKNLSSRNTKNKLNKNKSNKKLQEEEEEEDYPEEVVEDENEEEDEEDEEADNSFIVNDDESEGRNDINVYRDESIFKKRCEFHDRRRTVCIQGRAGSPFQQDPGLCSDDPPGFHDNRVFYL